MSIPKVFISYSHDAQEHKKWVLELAIRLRNNGIDAILDQFELKPGDDLPHFMETNLASSDYIIMVCTEKYIQKANGGLGGVGYEKMIITSSLMQHIDANKVIPIIRQNGSTDVPTFLKSKLYINFSKHDDYEYSYDDLVRVIHKSPLFEKPPVGNNPFKEIPREKLDSDGEILNEVLKQIMLDYEINDYPLAEDIAAELNISRIYLEVIMMKLIKLGYVEWVTKNKHINLTDKGKQYLVDNNMHVNDE